MRLPGLLIDHPLRTSLVRSHSALDAPLQHYTNIQPAVSRNKPWQDIAQIPATPETSRTATPRPPAGTEKPSLANETTAVLAALHHRSSATTIPTAPHHAVVQPLSNENGFTKTTDMVQGASGMSDTMRTTITALPTRVPLVVQWYRFVLSARHDQSRLRECCGGRAA